MWIKSNLMMTNSKYLSLFSGESSQLLGRTVGVAVGGAAAYIALVGAMLIYCRQRRQRLKHSPQHTHGNCSSSLIVVKPDYYIADN